MDNIKKDNFKIDEIVLFFASNSRKYVYFSYSSKLFKQEKLYKLVIQKKQTIRNTLFHINS